MHSLQLSISPTNYNLPLNHTIGVKGGEFAKLGGGLTGAARVKLQFEC
jgi:hypothetical protein